VLLVYFQNPLRLIIIMDGTTRIATGAITTDFTTAGTTICTGVGLPAFMVALGIIAIGRQSYSTVGAPTIL